MLCCCAALHCESSQGPTGSGPIRTVDRVTKGSSSTSPKARTGSSSECNGELQGALSTTVSAAVDCTMSFSLRYLFSWPYSWLVLLHHLILYSWYMRGRGRMHRRSRGLRKLLCRNMNSSRTTINSTSSDRTNPMMLGDDVIRKDPPEMTRLLTCLPELM